MLFLSPLLHRGAAVESEVLVPPDPEVLLHDVEHHGELGEDEDAVVPVLHVGQHAVEGAELARFADLVVSKAVVFNAL